jgi:putative tricarboxylic transport membrane protein
MAERQLVQRSLVDIAISLICLAFGLLVVWASDGISAPVVVDPIGPAAWPMIIGASIAFLAALEVIRSIMALRAGGVSSAAPSEKPISHDPRSRLRLLAAMGLLVLYLIGLSTLGYYSSTVPFVLALLLLLGIRSWWGLIICTVGLPLVWGLLFQRELGVPLPAGLIF